MLGLRSTPKFEDKLISDVQNCYPQYLEAVSSIRNLRTRHAVLKGTHITMKVKVKLSLCFNRAPHHEGILGNGGVASRLGRFTHRVRAPSTHWIGGWVGSRAVLDAVVKRKIPSPHPESKPRTPIVQPVATHITMLY
jgi:hypothetical protein